MWLPTICVILHNHAVDVTVCKDEADCMEKFRKICKEKTELTEAEIENGYKRACVKVRGKLTICLASAKIPEGLKT